jgi:hypothetical protein
MRHHFISRRSALQSSDPCLKEHRQIERRVEGQVQFVAQDLKELYGHDAQIDYGAIRRVVAAQLPDIQLINGSRETVAVHECGHFVAFEQEGLIAGKATIRGSAFDGGGWSGIAFPHGDVYLGSGRWTPVPEDLCRFARVTLAGPIAEELLAGGCALHNPGELLSARACSGRAAELAQATPSDVWKLNVLLAAALVECWSHQILELASMLQKRKEIDRRSPSVRGVLRTIAPNKIGGHRLSDGGRSVAERIILTTPATTDFIFKGDAT